MQKPVYLIIGVHNHQPVGNFGFIFEEAYQKAYLPFMNILEKHPSIKMTFHYSGVLLEWILVNHPEFFEKLRKLVKSGQVEFMTGGFYEPIFPMIPDRDKKGQIKLMTEFIRSNLGYDPKGLWLPERVWEPSLPKPLAESGVEYTVTDDYHFMKIGKKADELNGYYLTEEQGFPVKVFPISEKLRYLIPF